MTEREKMIAEQLKNTVEKMSKAEDPGVQAIGFLLATSIRPSNDVFVIPTLIQFSNELKAGLDFFEQRWKDFTGE